MKPEACLEVATRSRKEGDSYLEKGNVGRAFAHYLVALKLSPNWKNELSQKFITALCSWGETLDQQKRYDDLFNCYEQALEVFPDNEEVLNNLGSHLFRWGHITEACNYFRRALGCNPGFLPARRNLQGSCNFLVERWHFRMLNDSVRNDAYQAAITRRVLQRGSGLSVLDIGTGTGLLSLFAAEAGADQIYACDYSSAMIEIASQVLQTYKSGERVKLINKMSNDIIIPTDIPERVNLVITETVDAGLLGEGILQSLIHAWDHLLLPSDAQNVARVVPEAATVWIVPIECLHIARKYRVLKKSHNQTEVSSEDFDFLKLHLTAQRDEPYDTEDLSMVPGGYRFLAPPCQALQIKFNDRDDMTKWLNGEQKAEHWLECNEPGRVDALAAWFDLHLDDVTSISSTPCADSDGVHKANCWDQAVFPLQSPVFLKHSDRLKILVSCQGGKISIEASSSETCLLKSVQCALSSSKISDHFEECSGKSAQVVTSGSASVKGKSELQCSDNVSQVLSISPEAVRFLNDECWMEALEETSKCIYKQSKNKQMTSVLDLCPFPVLGLHLLKKLNLGFTCVTHSASDEAAIKRLAQLNGLSTANIQCIEEKQLEKNKTLYDIIVVHPVDQSGELKETVLNTLPVLRSSLTEQGILLPHDISIWGQLLESDWLNQVSRVQDKFNTCGFDIARFINIYQVSQHLDLNLSTLTTTRLSSPSELLHLRLDGDTYQTTQTVNMHATHSGKVTAVAYWYNIHVHESTPPVSTLHTSSHVSQAAILLEPNIVVCEGQSLKLLMRFHQGLIDVEPLEEVAGTG